MINIFKQHHDMNIVGQGGKITVDSQLGGCVAFANSSERKTDGPGSRESRTMGNKLVGTAELVMCLPERIEVANHASKAAVAR